MPNKRVLVAQTGKSVAAQGKTGVMVEVVRAPGKGRSRNARRRRNRGVDSTLRQGSDIASLHSTQGGASKPLLNFSVMPATTPGGMRVHGRELLRTVGTPAGGLFSATPVLLNPASFPRLQQIGNVYEMFVFHRARFIFQSSQPVTVTGVVELAADYDSKDSPPTTTISMMRNISSAMSNLYADCAMEVLSSLSRLPRYACSETVAPDENQVNQATVYVATEGTGATAITTAGYLICEYDVEFFTPQ